MSAPQMFERENKKMHTSCRPSRTNTDNDSKEVQHQYTQHPAKHSLYTVSRLSLEQEDASGHLDRIALHVSARAHLHLHSGPNTAKVAISENAPNMSCVYSRLCSVPVDFDPEQRLRNNCPPVAFSRTRLVSRVIKSRSL